MRESAAAQIEIKAFNGAVFPLISTFQLARLKSWHAIPPTPSHPQRSPAHVDFPREARVRDARGSQHTPGLRALGLGVEGSAVRLTSNFCRVSTKPFQFCIFEG